jgi:hypothetical protein
MLPLDPMEVATVPPPPEFEMPEFAMIDEDGMASSAERIAILRMIEQGKISAEDGARLLAALSGHNQAEKMPRPSVFDSSRNLQVRVSDLGSSRQKMNVTVPVGLVQLVVNWLPSSAKSQLEQVQAAIDAGVTGKLLEVVDQEAGVRVEIVLT